MSTWAVVSTDAVHNPEVADWCRVLRERLHGVVVVSPNGSPVGPLPVARGVGGPLDRLLAGLRAVPDHCDTVVFIDDAALEAVSSDIVVEMVGCLAGDDAAVARAIPVTDALKRVDGHRVLGAVGREGLMVLRTPHVFRREALDDALLALPDPCPTDLSGLLVATDLRVRMFRGLPHRARQARRGWPVLR
ncbi:MAG: 2-C-methyl-D-erythritol 4-phosphate cytidylyltransferase [Actinobacteria bacterium]|nr:2-C-methyl-D-erythritol 4-phosphate cytidylyltransferase [Actinomycetota bacterium]